jgi:hypothetical protein
MNLRTRLAGLEKRRNEVDREEYKRTIDATLQRRSTSRRSKRRCDSVQPRWG